MGSGAPKKARLIAVALTIRLTTQKETASRKVLCQVDNSLTIAVPMRHTRSNNIVGRQGESLFYLETLTCPGKLNPFPSVLQNQFREDLVPEGV